MTATVSRHVSAVVLVLAASSAVIAAGCDFDPANSAASLTYTEDAHAAYKEALALGLELNTYSWEGLATVKEILENPEAFQAALNAFLAGL